MVLKSKYLNYSITIATIVVGWHFLYEGIAKLMMDNWSAEGYLLSSTGPFAPFFHSLTTSPVLLNLVDWANIIGLLAIGLLLMVGLFVRFAAIAGALLLLLYYFANPPFIPTETGFAIEGHYWLINKNLIEAILLLVIATLPKESFLGIQQLITRKRAKEIKDGYSTLPSNETLERRNLLQNLIWLPFLGTVSLSLFKEQDSTINGTSSATMSQKEEIEKKRARTHKPNLPIGKAKGIFPGRVVWSWNPKSTNGLCTNTPTESGVFDENTDVWFTDRNTCQEIVDKMLADAIKQISGKEDLASAWIKIFEYHNQQKEGRTKGYRQGQKVFLKLNRTSAFFGINEDLSRVLDRRSFCSETSPQIVMAVLRQLINYAGVSQKDIYVGDPMREIFRDEFEKYSSEFADVNYLSHTDDPSRTKVTESRQPLIFYSDKKKVMPNAGSDKLYHVIEQADYLVNLPVMKAHVASGISLFAKNHFGTQCRETAAHLHPGLNEQNPGREKYGEYRVLVDFMGNNHTGGKNLIYILDALWAANNWNALPVKFMSSPFNNHWSSSLLVSLDPVAIESVAFDILRTEFVNAYDKSRFFLDKAGVDDYLHQSADSGNWPGNIVYAPNGDGKPIPDSLGVHEHWNNADEKMYSRNLQVGNGIELIKLFNG